MPINLALLALSESMFSQTPPKSYKVLMALQMLYLLLWIIGLLVNKKVIYISFLGPFPFSLIIAGFLFPFIDVITEVYGFCEAKKTVIITFLMLGIYAVVMTAIIAIPSPSNNPVLWANEQSPNAYRFMFDTLPRDFFALSIAYFLTTFINIVLISKWKILLKGRYFWLRSIGASGVGEFIYSVIVCMIILHSLILNNTHLLFKIIIISFLIKAFMTIVFAYPAYVLCFILKKIENIDVYDVGINFNPFKYHHGSFNTRV